MECEASHRPLTAISQFGYDALRYEEAMRIDRVILCEPSKFER